MIGQTVSHYKILEKLGEGGMGVVYRAEDLTLDRHVALKFLPHELSANEEAKIRFIREAKAASALQHPNICNIFEIDETQDGRLFMVMPCYEGETLRERLERGPLEIDEAMDVAVQVVSGLARAHEKGIVHRDIKPGNVMLTDGGCHAILMDFGLAKKLDATKMTRTGITMGTAAYMSPEQALGKETDERTDVWSLGVLLFEMFTGRLPFRGDVEAALLYSIVNEDPELVTAVRPEVPLRMEAIIEKALSKEVERRYQKTEELLHDLEEQRDKWALGIKERRFVTIGRKTKKRFLRASISAAVIVFAALFLFIYQKFRSVPPEAVALENSMAIMYFENMADPNDSDKTAEMITSLLTTGLGDSEYIKVISRQRVHDILKQLGKKEKEAVDKDTASEVAKRAGVNWAMTGTVIQREPDLVVSADVWHSVTGEVRTGVRKKFEADEDIFAVVDTLINEITKDLSLPKAALDRLHRSVTEVTTNSQEAYRHYLEGVDRYNKFYYAKAIESFEKALEFDSTLAMAYYWISRSGPVVDRQQQWAIAKAVQYSDRASRKEKKLISARSARMTGDSEHAIMELKKLLQEFPDERQAFEMLARIYRESGDFENAIANWQRVIELDPLDARTYNMLAYDYHSAGDEDSALVMINKYISLAPDEANPYDTRGDFYTMKGQIEKAVESYKKAAKIKPDFFSVEKLGDLYVHEGKYDAAEEWYREMLTSQKLSVRSRIRLKLAFIPLFQGKLDEALEVLNQGISADRLDGYEGPFHLMKYYHKWLVYAEKSDWRRSIAEAEKVFDLLGKSEVNDLLAWRSEYVILLAQKGDYSAAEETLKVLHSHIDTTSSNDLHRYRFARSQFEFEHGKPEVACTLLEKIAAGDSRNSRLQYNLGRAYLAVGRLSQAVDMLKIYTDTYFINVVPLLGLFRPLEVAKARYYLGIAYENSGWNDKAIEQYEKFLEMWKDADSNLDVIEDARRRLTSVQSTNSIRSQLQGADSEGD